MGLNCNIFLFLYLPIIAVIYYILQNLKTGEKAGKIWLIVNSLFIYGGFGYINLIYLLILFLFNYITGSLILKYEKRYSDFWFISGIAINIVAWLIIKYTLPLLTVYNYVFKTYYHTQEWMIPVGYGIIIIQQIFYLIECKKKLIKQNNIIDYLTFSTFFPKLIAGPLISYTDFTSQFTKDSLKVNYKNIASALFVIFYCLFLKVVFADTFSNIVKNGFDSQSLNFVQAWVVALCNTFNIFFDIYAYSGMAAGIALLFNIKLPDNFNSPFKAQNIKDFWQRWHITFTSFFINNIAKPLTRKRKNIFTCSIALLFTFVIMGIWHKMNIQFVLWGLLNALAIIAFLMFKNLKIPKIIRFIFMFVFLNFTWLLFTANGLSQALTVAEGMLSIKSIFIYYNEFYILWPIKANFIIVILLIVSWFIARKIKNTKNIIESFKPSLLNLCLLVLFIAISLLFNKENPFIYYGF